MVFHLHAENNCWTETYGHYSKALGQTDPTHSLVTTTQSWCHLDTSILTPGCSRCHPLPPCGHSQARLSQALPFSDVSLTALPLPGEHRHCQSRNRTKPPPPSQKHHPRTARRDSDRALSTPRGQNARSSKFGSAVIITPLISHISLSSSPRDGLQLDTGWLRLQKIFA